jgi:hypothetical protein
MVDAICTPYDINYFGANGLDFYGIGVARFYFNVVVFFPFLF